MSIIGEKFKKNQVYIPEVLIAARVMHAGMDVLKPKLTETGVKNIGKVVMGCKGRFTRYRKKFS